MNNKNDENKFNEMMDIAAEEQKQRLSSGLSKVKDPRRCDLANDTINGIIKKSSTHEEYVGWLKGNILMYRLNAGKENSIEQDIMISNMYQTWYDLYIGENQP